MSSMVVNWVSNATYLREHKDAVASCEERIEDLVQHAHLAACLSNGTVGTQLVRARPGRPVE